MPVSSQHKDYTNNIQKWRLVRDCVEGSNAIKSAKSMSGNASGLTLLSLPGTQYLPAPNPEDNSAQNKLRYQAYRDRANFVNFTAYTKDGFAGMIARLESEKDFPAEAEYLLENADGAGLSIDEIEHRVTDELMTTGRIGLLVDFPASDGGTVAQTNGLQASIKTYTAENIINWKTEVIDGRTVLSMVVLLETVEKQLDEFESECVKQYRVLRLLENTYVQQLYDEDENLIYSAQPRNSAGALWREIPFVIAGTIDNGPSVDKATLYDLAEINIAHYRNSADFEESSFIVGQPTPVFTGLNQAWVKEILKGGVQIGSRAGVLLPEGANALLLQANSNQMPSEGMKEKELQMIKVGAKIITDSSGAETAEAARIRFSGQNSKLALVVCNAERALIKCVEWVLEFMGGSGEIVYEINKQFYESTVNPQLLVANIQLMDRGVIGKTDVRDYLRKSGVIDAMRTDEELDSELDQVDPFEASPIGTADI
jgi:hypothetical protein